MMVMLRSCVRGGGRACNAAALCALVGWAVAAACVVYVLSLATPTPASQARAGPRATGPCPGPGSAGPNPLAANVSRLRLRVAALETQLASSAGGAGGGGGRGHLQREPSGWSIFEANETDTTLHGFSGAAPAPNTGGRARARARVCSAAGFQAPQGTFDLLCIFESEDTIPATSWGVGSKLRPTVQLIDTSLEQDYYARRDGLAWASAFENVGFRTTVRKAAALCCLSRRRSPFVHMTVQWGVRGTLSLTMQAYTARTWRTPASLI